MVFWENKLVNMEMFRTHREVRQRVRDREKIVEDTEGSLPATHHFWKLANTSFSDLVAKGQLFLMEFTDVMTLGKHPQYKRGLEDLMTLETCIIVMR